MLVFGMPRSSALFLAVLFVSSLTQSHACTFEVGDKFFDLSTLHNAAGYTMMSNGYQYRFDICNSCDEQCRVGTFSSCQNKVFPSSAATLRTPQALSVFVFILRILLGPLQYPLLNSTGRRPATSILGPAAAKPWAT